MQHSSLPGWRKYVGPVHTGFCTRVRQRGESLWPRVVRLPRHMSKRNVVRWVSLFALSLSMFGAAPAARAESAGPPTQMLSDADQACGDNPTDCAFPETTAQHRYLHVVLHDAPGDVDWGVWVGRTCNTATTELAGAVPVRPSGYVEVVVDLVTGGGPVYTGTPLCFLLRGGYGRASTYYGSYFDDSRVPDASLVYPTYQQLGGRLDLADLDVTYIHRSPAYAFDAHPNQPSVGQNVAYEAHVTNQGGRPISSFSYRWLLDGSLVEAGDHSDTVPPLASVTIALTLPWTAANHRLTFEASTSDRELSVDNNQLTIDTGAISLGFWVEQSAYAYFRDYQQRYCAVQGCAGADSFEDWLQRQVLAWNGMFRQAKYANVAPHGVVTRVRVDEIVVVPDGALPLHGGIASDSPDRLDHTVDLEWGLPARDVAAAYTRTGPGPFRIDWALLHELGHARSLADLYRFDFPVASPSQIDVVGTDGRPAYDAHDPIGVAAHLRGFFGSDGGTLVYQNAERDLMSCVCSAFYSRYSALVLNRLGNRRAICGNVNPPCNMGDWYAEMPPKSVLRILTPSGRIPRGPTTVRVFFDSGGGYGTHRFTQADTTALHVSGDGFAWPKDPFQTGGSLDRAGHNLDLIEVTTPTTDEFCFEEPTAFNEAYWAGYVDQQHPAVFTLRLGHEWQNGCNLSLPPAIVNEPFGTSPLTSTIMLGPAVRTSHGMQRLATVQLLDASRLTMHRRQVVLFDGQKRVIARGVTDQAGRFQAYVSWSTPTLTVVDVTDNHLILGWESRTPQPRAVRR